MKQQLATNHSEDRLGSYHLLQLLGKGGSGRVYVGKHIYLGTKAAIKVLNARLTRNARRNFLIEARLLASMRHHPTRTALPS
jgi:eukaryotic-like serine/threonine-protein kinase